MSYNIDTFKVTTNNNLRIPVKSLFTHERKDWHPEQRFYEDRAEFEILETTLSGSIESDIFICDSIDCSGEGSGTAMRYILEPALKESTGELTVSCVWEGGDTINRLIVKDGNVRWEDGDYDG